MQSPQSAPAGARCAAHPELAATAVCSRCGNFMCSNCTQGGAQALCPACLATYGGLFPFRRDDFDFGRVWDYCWNIFTREWVMLSVAVIIFFGISMVGSMITNVIMQIGMQATIGSDPNALAKDPEKLLNPRTLAVFGALYLVVILIQMVVNGVGVMGLIRVGLDVLNGKKVDLGRMFFDIRKLGRYVGVQLLMMLAFLVAAVPFGVVIGLGVASHGERQALVAGGLLAGTATFFVLGIALLPLLLAQYEVVYGDAGVVEALGRSWRLGGGFRLPIFGYSFVGGLVIIAGFIACCIGVLPALALQQLIVGGLYLALRNGSDLPRPTEA